MKSNQSWKNWALAVLLVTVVVLSVVHFSPKSQLSPESEALQACWDGCYAEGFDAKQSCYDTRREAVDQCREEGSAVDVEQINKCVDDAYTAQGVCLNGVDETIASCWDNCQNPDPSNDAPTDYCPPPNEAIPVEWGCPTTDDPSLDCWNGAGPDFEGNCPPQEPSSEEAPNCSDNEHPGENGECVPDTPEELAPEEAPSE